MKTALGPSPPSCGDTPAEGFPGGGSASPWISPLTLSCWCRGGRQWTPPRSHQWSPLAADKWGGGTVAGQQKCVVKIEYGWVCVCVCVCVHIQKIHSFVVSKTTKLCILNEWNAWSLENLIHRVCLKPSVMLEGIRGSRRFPTAPAATFLRPLHLSC